VPTLERLRRGRHPLAAVVSQPDRPRGRGRRTTPSPVSQRALDEGVRLLRPEKLAGPEIEGALRELRADLGVVVAFGQFLPRWVRELPSLGYCINGHASLLPRWRGAAPIAHAVLAGDRETGVSVMRVEREMDAGPVARRRALEIASEETTGQLAARLAALTAELIAEVVEEIAAERVHWAPQDHSRATQAPKLRRADAHLDFSQPAEALVRRIRAMSPTPGAFATLHGELLRVLAARAEPGRVPLPPGTLQRPAGAPLAIATGDGWLLPTRLQRAGGRALSVEDYLRGRPLSDGDRLS